MDNPTTRVHSRTLNEAFPRTPITPTRWSVWHHPSLCTGLQVFDLRAGGGDTGERRTGDSVSVAEGLSCAQKMRRH
jgi:hypothetical protein